MSRDNGITTARLLLALFVVVSHAFALDGLDEPLAVETGNLVTLGSIAVIGFFALSGWLLAGSRERNTVGHFVRNRALRILPGYWLALVFGGALIALAGGDAIDYVGSNLSIIFPGAPGWPDGSAVNGSLWTLGPEVICYAVLAVAPVRLLRPMALGWVIVLVLLWPWLKGIEDMLFLAFGLGVGVRVFDIPVTRQGALVATLVAVPLWLAVPPLAIIATSYAALGLMHLPFRTNRDLSYGTYVFAYPVQKVLAAEFDTLGVIVGTMVIVLPLAWLSWTFVESRALRLPKMPAVGRASERLTASTRVVTRSMRTLVVRALLR